jgi:RTX calcium-binding nonapeptide repeat (4 copies)
MASSHIAPPASTLGTRRLVAALAAVCALLAAGGNAPTADAAVTCQFSGGALTIQSSAVLDDAWIVRSGDNIVVRKSLQTPVNCGVQATVYNTHVIAHQDNSGGDTAFEIDLRGGPFSPGQVDEPGNTDEIDIQALMGAGSDDRLYIWGSQGEDFWRLGQTTKGLGVNLNAGLESALGATPDVDVDLRDAEMGVLMSGAGNDHVLASGGPEFTGPFPGRVDVNGEEGNDQIAGGTGPDNITDGPGDDDVSGGADKDQIIEWGPTAGNDQFDGGPGTDFLGYGDFTAPMRIDLRTSARQDTGAGGRDVITGFENVTTGDGNDVLIGTDGDNWLSAGSGDDLILGLGGSDRMYAGPGNDTASYATPAAGVSQGVIVDLSKPSFQDTGGAGADLLNEFENVIGSPFADDLTGTNMGNRFEVRDGQGDRVACGDGLDTVVADVDGTDTVRGDCDTVQLDFRPDTMIDGGPAGLTRDGTPAFRFSATKPGSSFECSLDGRPFAACQQAQTFARLANGAHILRVRSRDSLGAADLSPAERAFSIDATPPRISRARFTLSGRLQYRLSEAATVKIAIRRCVRAHDGQCSRFGRARIVTRRGTRGANSVAPGHGIPVGLARADRYRVSLRAIDRAGNRSAPVRRRSG